MELVWNTYAERVLMNIINNMSEGEVKLTGYLYGLKSCYADTNWKLIFSGSYEFIPPIEN